MVLLRCYSTPLFLLRSNAAWLNSKMQCMCKLISLWCPHGANLFLGKHSIKTSHPISEHKVLVCLLLRGWVSFLLSETFLSSLLLSIFTTVSLQKQKSLLLTTNSICSLDFHRYVIFSFKYHNAIRVMFLGTRAEYRLHYPSHKIKALRIKQMPQM